MKYVKVSCCYCGKNFPKEVRRFNEAKKNGWKIYCSLNCQKLSKNKRVKIKCGSPLCNKFILRDPSDIPESGICYCSCSCAAVVNNKKFPKRKPVIKPIVPKICKKCKKEFYDDKERKYCSPACYSKRPIFPAEKIIEEIKEFYEKNGRIPVKREYHAYRVARFRFGTWNKAIKAAGFDPNPVLFAKKHVAKDSHICDSLSEMIIDNWLFARKISHEKNVPYLNTLFTADFKVKDIFIEFFGLHKELKRYDQLMKTKLKIIKDNNLKLIAIYPKDIFPKPRLNEILDDIISK